jgi:serine phosphatase RsbU (regulator of sigma subunit)
LRYANAGHDLPYLWHGGDAEELRARVMPLGLMLGMSYEQKEMVLEADEIALFYSDGLVEAHNPYGEIFGFPRLRTLVAEHGEEASLGNLLQEDLHPFTREGWEQEDDITLLTLRRLIA